MNLFLTLAFSLIIGLNSIIQGPFTGNLSAIEAVHEPLDEPYKKSENPAPPCVIVIFGATGDLTARKLLPAIYNLAHEGNLSKQTAVIGFARGEHTDKTFRKQMGSVIDQFAGTHGKDADFWGQFENKIFYSQSSFEQDQGYENLQKLLLKIDEELGTQGNRIYYLATQPSYFSTNILITFKSHLVKTSGLAPAHVFGKKQGLYVIFFKTT